MIKLQSKVGKQTALTYNRGKHQSSFKTATTIQLGFTHQILWNQRDEILRSVGMFHSNSKWSSFHALTLFPFGLLLELLELLDWLVFVSLTRM